MFTFLSPWCLLALLFPPAARLIRHALRKRRAQRPAAVPFSALAAARSASRSWRVRLRALPDILADLAFAALVLALARPQSHVTATHTENASEGIAIEMVLDRSASMSRTITFDRTTMTRLEAVKKIFAQFVRGDGNSLKGRAGDLVGLVTFAKSAQTDCPLTLSHDALTDALDDILLVHPADLNAVRNAARRGLDLNAVLIATDRRELYHAFAEVYGNGNAPKALENYTELQENNRTAVGDALALGIARLQQADTAKKTYKIASKVLILLTDGENNFGRDIPSVLPLAKDAGIKIHVIAIGEARTIAQNDLPRLAKETGGSCTYAENADELLAVYRDIDALERSELTDVAYTAATEAFPPFLLAALALSLLRILLITTLFRTTP